MPEPPLGAGVSDTLRSAFLRLPNGLQKRVLTSSGRVTPWTDGKPPVAPPCPEGMTTGAPEFVGVGVSKCGTSWWFSLIRSHPEIHPTIRKELQFFNQPFVRGLATGRWSDAQMATYLDWFPRPAGTITGEWTPHYFFWDRLAPVIHHLAPEAKILIMLRDPVERYKSDISRHMNRQHQQITRLKGLARGFYNAEMEPWAAAFDPDQILLLQYEACNLDPAGQLAATYRFLGVDDGFVPDGLRAAVNKTKKKRDVDSALTRMLTDVYEPDVRRLAARYPSLDLALWPNFAHLA